MANKESAEKRKYDIIFHDRKQLTDYEKDELIPEIKLKLTAIRKGSF